MSKIKKLTDKLLANPKDLTWDELVKLLSWLGFQEIKKSGSSRKFVDTEKNVINGLHEPHAGKPLKQYQIDIVVQGLKDLGKL